MVYPLDDDVKMHQTGYVNDTFETFMQAHLGVRSNRRMAAALGMDNGKLQRHLRGDAVNAQTVIALCRIFNAPVLPALIAAGIITAEEASTMDVEVALARATERQLVEETLRRVAEGEATGELTGPVSQDAINVVEAEGASARVTRLHDVGGREKDDVLYGVELDPEEIAATDDDTSVDPNRGDS